MNKKLLIVKQSEPLFIDNVNTRLWRASMIQKYASKEGMKTTYLTSTFDHYTKKMRFKSTSMVERKFGKYVFLKTPGYSKNISLARIWDSCVFGVKVFLHIFINQKDIDVIFVAFPTVESAFFASLSGKFLGKKVVVDVRDLWPDVIIDSLSPNFISRIIFQVLLLPYYIMARLTFLMADSISAPTQSYLDWAKARSLGGCSKMLLKLPFGYAACENNEFDPKFEAVYENQIKGRKICMFAGTLNRMWNFEPLMYAAKSLENDVLFLIAGDGSEKERLELEFSSCSNVIFLGWLGKEGLCSLMRLSTFGLAPYLPLNNFNKNVPNKIIEYLSSSLIVVYSLGGEIDSLLDGIGLRYAPESPNSLRNVLHDTLNSPSDLSKKSLASQALFQDFFDAKAVYTSFVRKHLQ